MKRLTKRVGSNVVACTFDMDFVLDMSEKEYAEFMNLMEKLADYEDAEEEGRLVILPCKVGDTVYFLILGKIIEKQVFSIVTFSNSSIIYCSGTSEYFRPEQFGKTVFLTREEAEAALDKMKG